MEVTRSTFVKGAAIAATATAGALASTLPRNAFAAAPVPEQWDKEADLVVLGSGTALTGALKAALEGASVIVVEKAAITGGTTAFSGGQVWVPCNRYATNPDDRDLARAYMVRCADGLATDAKIDAYLDTASEMVNMVADVAGVEWSVSPRADYHSNWEGASTDTRSLAYWIDGSNVGRSTTDAECAALEQLGAEILTSTAAQRLIARPLEDGRSEVLGVLVSSPDGPLTIKARKGVLIGTGGYSHNWDMLKNYLAVPPRYSMSIPEDTGDGILMGQALGANLTMMAYIWGEACLHDVPDDEFETGTHMVRQKIYLYNTQPSSIFVDRTGKRFCCESVDYDSLYFGFMGQSTTGDMEPHNIPAYYICDQTVRDTMGDSFFGVKTDEEVPSWAVQADTLEELAEKLGIDGDGLVSQVEKWNADAATGIDTDFHRGELAYETHNRYRQEGGAPFNPIQVPPYYGAVIMPAAMGTKGGLEINEKGQVVHVSGDIIPRLYACGNATGTGSPGKYYTGAGATLGAGMVFGYLAAQDALTLDDWA